MAAPSAMYSTPTAPPTPVLGRTLPTPEVRNVTFPPYAIVDFLPGHSLVKSVISPDAMRQYGEMEYELHNLYGHLSCRLSTPSSRRSTRARGHSFCLAVLSLEVASSLVIGVATPTANGATCTSVSPKLSNSRLLVPRSLASRPVVLMVTRTWSSARVGCSCRGGTRCTVTTTTATTSHKTHTGRLLRPSRRGGS